MREPDVRKDRDRERALLLLCARVRIPAADHPRIRALTAQTLDWDDVVETADWHGVASLLLKSLQSAGADVPRMVLERLEHRVIETTAANLSRVKQLADVLNALHTQRIPGVAWKGPGFAACAYGHIGLRASADIDLIVPREFIRDVRDVMMREGYIPSNRTRHLFDSVVPATAREYEFVPPDPRWAAVEAQVAVAPWPLAVRLSAQDLIDRATVIDVASVSVPMLCAEDLLLALALHGTSHLWASLRLMTDVDALIGSGVDWQIVFGRARSARMLRMLTVALSLAHRLLETPLPDAALDVMRRDRVAPHLTNQYAKRLFAPVRPWVRHLWRDWVYVNSRERLSDRFRYGLRQLAFEHAIRHWDRVTVRRAARRAPQVTRSG